jgi:NAD(P)-dependent dehydrogenase (short-subunit alcohol dehydrogenase family)
MSRLNGKVAVITGGSSGIGLATAQRFAQEGAYVFITGRRQSELDKAKALIGNDVTTVAGDASKNTDLDKLFATVLEQKGGLDILVANSGRVEPEELGKITEENFDATFDLNARATLFTVQKALPLMRDGGSVIIVGSVAGYIGVRGYTTYSATKAALRSYTRTWTREFNDRGHPVQHVEPGAHRHPHHGWASRLARGRGRDQGGVRSSDTAPPDGSSGGNRLRCFVFGVRRQQLRGRRRAERRWWHGPGLNAQV